MVKVRKAVSMRAGIVAVALCVAVVLACAGCTSAPEQGSSAEEVSSSSEAVIDQVDDIAVSVSVTGPDEEVILAPAVVTIEQEGTALEALQASGLDVIVTDSSYGPFVEAIGDVAGEGSAGWTYTVNGTTPQVSAGSCVVNDGDAVEWVYAAA